MGNKILDITLGVFIVIAIMLSIVNFSLINSRNEKITGALLLAEKENQPAKLELIKIDVASCQNCFDIDSVIDNLKKANVEVISETAVDFSLPEAKQLISQHNIEKLPTVIVLGEVNKSSVVNLWDQNWQVEMKDGTQVSAVYSAVAPPYADASGNIKGLVTLTHILDESCPECADLAQIIGFFKQNGVKFSSEKTIDYASPEARDLIAKFEVQRVPALIVSKDILDYSAIAQIWNQLNATEKQGFYALHTTVPPYRDLATDNINGLVKVIYLNDSACTGCYNVQVNKQILERNFGVTIESEENLDVNSDSGKALVKKYAISKVPLILVSPDANFYPVFVQIWPQVGDVADDGWFVMRSPEVLGTYKDLSSGQVISPPKQQGG